MVLFSSTQKQEFIMALSKDELKAAILEKAEKSPKPQLYIKDFYACDPEAKPRDVKNVANDLVKEGKMMFWSSGSTTMYALKHRIKNEEGSGGI
jgi:Dissimilatory sulfite reductase D (DsrD)